MRKVRTIKMLNALTGDVPEVALEPGIRMVVGILNSKGLATSMSCEGHRGSARDIAWVQLEPGCFKHYMARHASKMERFLRAGEGLWVLRLEYFAKSAFRGLGRPRPRSRNLKRVLMIDLAPRIILKVARAQKASALRALESAAERYL